MAGLLKLSLVLTFSFTVFCVQAQVGKYRLDNSSNNDCGKTIKIYPNEEIILTSSGRTPKDVGFCNVMVYAVAKDGKKCHGMCMTVDSQYMDVCHAKIQFKGMDFGKDDDPFKELSCFHRFPNEFCLYKNVMSVEIVETHFYAFDSTKKSYNFSVKVDPLCDDSPFGKDIAAREAAEKEEAGNSRSRARNHGILVGVCLAIVFLIVLFMTWCYYKNKPFGTDVHNYSTSTVRKRPTLAGFKAKMTFHKSSSSDDCEAKQRKEKKQKHSKDDATTENDETKPKKRGLRFLNKLRTNRAEEVPLVEQKDEKVKDSGDAEDKVEEINEIKEDEKLNNQTDNEIQDTKTEDVADNGSKKDTEDNVQGGDDVTAENAEEQPKIETPSVTVTTPGDNETGSKNDSSDDS